MKRKLIAIVAIVLVLGMTLLICGAAGNAPKDEVASPADNTSGFSDVDKTDWFCDDVAYVSQNKLMTGTSKHEFSPNDTATRGMIVTILWRLEGSPVSTAVEFEDVDANKYYHDAVSWAADNKIVSGYDKNSFGPNDTATREQLAAIMYRYAAYKKYDVKEAAALDQYDDRAQISDYAVDSIRWAVANKILSGTSEKTISPQENVQRCQVAAILKRFCVNIAGAKSDAANDTTPKEDDTVKNDSAKDNTNTSKPDHASDDNDKKSDDSQKNDVETTYPEIIVDSAEAKAGEEVQVKVFLKNNPGILGMTLTLYYDENKCVLKKAESGAAVNGILDFTTSKELGNGARFLWDGIEISDQDIHDGEILILTFAVKENAAEGSCPITLKYMEDDIVDNDLTGLSPYVRNGEITIKK